MKRTLNFLIIFVLMLSNNLNAACLEGDCSNGSGKLESSDGRIYEGQFQNGYLWGEGILTMPDGSIYTGQFIKGKY